MGKSNKWPWHEPSGYGELFYKRATGENEEMESSKALCKFYYLYTKKEIK